MRFILALVIGLFLSTAALAVGPDEILSDPVLETRAREISRELRCLVCQNETIDDSQAELARDLRLLVRERLVKGDSNEEVVSFIHQRYGDFVLMTPPVVEKTFLLWGAPLLVLLGGAGLVFVTFRRKGG